MGSETMERDIGRLIAGQESMQTAIATLANSVNKISETQQSILEIQAHHSTNAELIEKNNTAIVSLHQRHDKAGIEISKNTEFRKALSKALWIIGTPSLVAVGGALLYLVSKA